MSSGAPISARAAATRCCWPTLRLAAVQCRSATCASMPRCPAAAAPRPRIGLPALGAVRRFREKLQRQHDIVDHRAIGQQIEHLEDNAVMLGAEAVARMAARACRYRCRALRRCRMPVRRCRRAGSETSTCRCRTGRSAAGVHRARGRRRRRRARSGRDPAKRNGRRGRQRRRQGLRRWRRWGAPQVFGVGRREVLASIVADLRPRCLPR